MPHLDAPADQGLLDSLSVAVLKFDSNGRLEFLNAAAAALCQLNRRHALGRSVEQLLPADSALPPAISRARDAQETVSLREHPLRIGLPPGEPLLVMCEVTPQESSAILLEIIPVARFRRIEDESRLLRQNDTQRLLVKALAHEIKNPLGGMRGAAQLLAAELDGEELQDYLKVIIREADRLRDLVDRLLGPGGRPRREWLNVHEILEHVAAVLEPELPDRIHWQRDYDPSLPDLALDPDQLTQVFLNIAGNSIAALAESPPDSGEARLVVRTRVERNLTVRGERHRLALRVDISDNGPGVPEEIADSLFFPLVTGRNDGTGMGLAVAQDIVQRHGGLIEWERKENRTTFKVLLPIEPFNGGHPG